MRFLINTISLLLLSHLPLKAQFISSNEVLGELMYNDGGTETGKAISVYDIDHNGWDDITISRGDQDPLVLLNDNGVLNPAPFNFPNDPAGFVNMLLWADIDNDGDADLLVSRAYAPIQLWRNNGNWQFENIASTAGLEQSIFDYKGAAFCDYDHDGLLDLFITKFYNAFSNPGMEYRNILYHNDGNGTFSNVNGSSGVLIETKPVFQPVFFDYDGDGWEDLLLVIDRNIIQNELFHNNGDGTFSNVSQESGMDLWIDAMSGTIGDPDNDGDLDVFLTDDPPEGHSFMRNNGNGTFSNVASSAGLDLVHVGWGSLWVDYDNDSWEDLFVSVEGPIPLPIGNQFFINQQNGTFIASNAAVGLLGDLTETYVCARGDLNNDGYFDIMTSNAPEFPLTLYMNDGGENHWLSVNLQGTLSNRDGIGSWLHCYVGGEHYVRFTSCGSDLLNQNSSKQIFGLGPNAVVDSLVIEWNSGTREVYAQPEIDQHHHYIEGATLVPETVEITSSGSTTLCAGASVILDAGEFESYLWNTGHQERYMEVAEPGEYQVTVTDIFGFEIISETIIVSESPELAIQLNLTNISCYGASDGSISVSINTGPMQSIIWNTGDTGLTTISGLEGGAYSFQLVDNYGCSSSDGAYLEEPLPVQVVIAVSDVLCFGGASGMASLETSGGNPPYSTNWFGVNPQALPAGEFQVEVIDAQNCSTAVDFTINEPPSLELNVVTTPAPNESAQGSAILFVEGGVPGYSVQWSNGLTDLYSVDSLEIGEYFVSVSDANGCTESFGFEIGIVTGIAAASTSALQVFPTMADTELRIVNCIEPSISFKVFDRVGKLQLTMEGHDPGQPINIQRLANGPYDIVIQCGGRVSTTPFMKFGP